jgi:G3E family GTPase
VTQVEFADLLVVNKTDCISSKELEQLTALLSELNPKAKVGWPDSRCVYYFVFAWVTYEL